MHQIENGLKNVYTEDEIKEAVIKAINLALSLRSYLEGMADLTLAKLRRIMRSHYQEKTATELYHQLSSTVQKPKEKPQEFLIRLLDLKQKVLFASQESDSELKYDPTLVHGMFVHSFSIGLQNENIKVEMKPHLEKKTVSDEELFEKLNVCVSNEMERSQKQGTGRRKRTARWSKPLLKKLGSLRQKLLQLKRKFGPHLHPKPNLPLHNSL